MERIDEALALEAGDGHLAGERALGGTVAEGVAGGGPWGVGRALEVGEDDVIGGAGGDMGEEERAGEGAEGSSEAARRGGKQMAHETCPE